MPILDNIVAVYHRDEFNVNHFFLSFLYIFCKVAESKEKEKDGQKVFRRGHYMELVVTVWNSAVCFLAGILLGKFGWRKEETRENRKEEGMILGERKDKNGTSFFNGEKRILMGTVVGSPASGAVSWLQEENRKAVRILPEEGKIYAPASGKIIRLFPAGNAMVLRMDNGTELTLRAGGALGGIVDGGTGGDADEAADGSDGKTAGGAAKTGEERYFSLRIVRNEVVNKGKLLMEYDLEKLEEEGCDPAVLLTVEKPGRKAEPVLCCGAFVKAGEDLLEIPIS